MGPGSSEDLDASSSSVIDGVYIQQAAAMVGSTPSSLRSWEKYGLVSPARTSAGYRVYTLDHVVRLRRVRSLLAAGVNPAGALRVLEQDDEQSPNGDGGAAGQAKSAHTPVGKSIHALRKKQGFSLRELAERTELSPSYISSIERAITSPSIASLQKLARGLDTNVLAILGDNKGASRAPVVGRHERSTVHSASGVTIEDLSTKDSALEPLIFTVQPGSGSQGHLSHVGEEFLFVLAGELVITLDHVDDYELSEGDSMTFDSLRPHEFRNESAEMAKVIWINTPRTF